MVRSPFLSESMANSQIADAAIHQHRAQVAALPVRSGPNGVEVMLITSRETRRWVVPKGWPMKGRKDHEAAAQEALEEAGLVGHIHKHPIGAYTYVKQTEGASEPCRVMVYRLDVGGERRTWRERGQRERQWFAAAEAANLVAEPRLATMIRSIAKTSLPNGDANEA